MAAERACGGNSQNSQHVLLHTEREYPELGAEIQPLKQTWPHQHTNMKTSCTPQFETPETHYMVRWRDAVKTMHNRHAQCVSTQNSEPHHQRTCCPTLMLCRINCRSRRLTCQPDKAATTHNTKLAKPTQAELKQAHNHMINHSSLSSSSSSLSSSLDASSSQSMICCTDLRTEEAASAGTPSTYAQREYTPGWQHKGQHRLFAY